MDTERSTDARFRPNIDEEIDRAWVLHVRGGSMRDIAAELKCAVATAKARVDAGRERNDAEAAMEQNHARVKVAINLDRWQSWLEDAHRLGDENALKLARMALGGGLLQLEERRAKLLGVDAVTRFSMQINDKPPEPPPSMATIRAIAEELDAYEARKAEVKATDGLNEFDQ